MKGKIKKYIFAFVVLIFFIISIVYTNRIGSNEVICKAIKDTDNNMYILSHDSTKIYIRKINNKDTILWEKTYKKDAGNKVNIEDYLRITENNELIIGIAQKDLINQIYTSWTVHKFSKDGKEDKEIYSYASDSEYNIYSMDYKDGFLYFTENDLKKSKDDMRKFEVKCLNINDGECSTLDEFFYEKSVNMDDFKYSSSGKLIFTTYRTQILKRDNHNNVYLYPDDITGFHEGITGIGEDAEGNIYFYDIESNKILKIDNNANKIEFFDCNELEEKINEKCANINYVFFQNENEFYARKGSTEIIKYDNGNLSSIKIKDLKYNFKLMSIRILVMFSGLVLVFLVVPYGIKKIVLKLNNRIFTIITKQIIISIIIISASILIMYNLVENKIKESVYNKTVNELAYLTIQKVSSMDMSFIEDINWNNPYEDENLKKLQKEIELKTLNKQSIYNYTEQKEINIQKKVIVNRLILVKDGKLYTGINEYGISINPLEYIYGLKTVNEYSEKIFNGDLYVKKKLTNEDELIIFSIPIYNDKFEVIAAFESRVSVKGYLKIMIYNYLKNFAVIDIVIGLATLLILIGLLKWMIKPLKTLNMAVTELKNGQFGIQVPIRNNDEIGSISKVFNTMSAGIKEKFNEIVELNIQYYKYVPSNMLQILNKEDAIDIELGDYVKDTFIILYMSIQNLKELLAGINQTKIFDYVNNIFNKTVNVINRNGGIIEDYYNDGMLVMFKSEEKENAVNASIIALQEMRIYNTENSERNIELGFIINLEEILFGIIGCEERIGTAIFSDYLYLINKLNKFIYKYGISIMAVESLMDSDIKNKFNYRMIGHVYYKNQDVLVEVYDIFDGDDYDLLKMKKQTKHIFEKGVMLFEKGRYYEARTMFIDVLKKCQNDKAAKEYVILCDECMAENKKRTFVEEF